TGLYYYGYRYYQPWAGRWLSADPAGMVDGLNLFRMCRNNPGTLFDKDGKISDSQSDSGSAETSSLSYFISSFLTIENIAAVTAGIATIAYGAYKLFGSKTSRLFDSKMLSQWENLNADRKLIHVVQSRYSESSLLFKKPADQVFNKWDILSTSLVDASLIQTPEKRSGERYTGLGGSLGFMIEAPPQNILGTHPHDVSFPTHEKGWGLADSFLNGLSKNHDNPLNHPNYNLLMSPDELLNKRSRGVFKESDYNEVLLAGRPGIRTYSDYPATDSLKVTGIVLIPEAATGVATQHEIKLAQKLKEVNPKLPVYRVVNRKFKVAID
ncbi:hypothetical protein M8R90_23915, partial [Enterobacter hormaechei]|nr:hypothetical protein [Enterobacter hormaechei]